MSKIEPLFEQLTPSESNVVVESASASGSKDLWLNGVFMQAAITNRNGRVYPMTEVSKAVEYANSRIQESNGIFGELDHPQSLNINLDRISHVITEMKMVGENAVGRAKILSTPMGNIARTLIESGVRVGVSSRGAGQVNESIVSDFNFITVDLVATPSAPGALPNSIYESLQMDKHGKEVLTLAEQIQHDQKAQQFFEDQVLKFLSNINWKK